MVSPSLNGQEAIFSTLESLQRRQQQSFQLAANQLRGVGNPSSLPQAARASGLYLPRDFQDVSPDALRQLSQRRDLPRRSPVRRRPTPSHEPIHLTGSLQASIAYNSNVSNSQTDKQHDWIFRPQVVVGVVWNDRHGGSLKAGFGVGYDHYLRGTRDNSLRVSPDSAITYTKDWGPTTLEFHDMIVFSTDPIDDPSAAGVSQFGGIQNTLGFAVNHSASFATLGLNYDHFNFFSTEPASDRQERVADNVVASAMIQILPYLSMGPELSGGWTRFDQTLLSDHVNLGAGWVVTLQLTPNIDVQTRAGITTFDFDPSDLTPAASNHSGAYAAINLSQILSEKLYQSLSWVLSRQSGLNSSLTENRSLQYRLIWNPAQDLTWGLSGSVHERDELMTSLLGSTEQSTRYLVGTNVRVRLTGDLYVNADYRYVYNDSNLALRKFRQHMPSLGLSLRF